MRAAPLGVSDLFNPAPGMAGALVGLLLLFGAAIPQPSCASEGTVILVADGKASCQIVAQGDSKPGKGLHGESPLSESIADFQRILEKMSGARVPIVSPQDARGDGLRVYVGNVPLPDGIRVDESRLDARGYLILATTNALVLRGKTDGGTANALYGFLQDKLDVRWFFPSELFEVVPFRKTISIPYCNEVHTPSFRMGVVGGLDTGLSNEGQRWAERMRIDEGAWELQGACVHYLGYILDSAIYGKTHPEFYPLINGARLVPPPGRADSAPQPCLSNANLVDAVVGFVRNSFAANPSAVVTAIGENDSTDWCECRACKAMDRSTEMVNGMVQHSDRYFSFANAVARELAKSHPGKLVGCLAYNGTVSPPRRIERLEPNVAIGMCVDASQYFDKVYQVKDYELLSEWKNKCRHIVLYEYFGLGWSAPRYYPHLAAEHLKLMHKRGVQGFYTEGYPYWATFGPMVYLAAQLMWDVSKDPDKVLNDLFTKLFGTQAGREMSAFYSVFEGAWMRSSPGRSGKYFEGWSSMREQMAIYKLADLDAARAHLTRARESACDEISRKRIEYIAHSFRYSEILMEGWLTSDAIDQCGKEGITSDSKAEGFRRLLMGVAHALTNEESVYQQTLLVDPISAKGYYKAGHTDHFGIIRGAWAPRCRYSLINGAAQILAYYAKQKLSKEVLALKHALPEDIVRAAESLAGEVLGDELIQNGDMENGNPPVHWTESEATLSADPDRHSGKQSLLISASADLGSAKQAFAVKPDTRYRLEFWYKCSRPGSLYIQVSVNGSNENQYGEIKDENVWTRWSAEFRTPRMRSATVASIGFCSWPGKNTRIDDVSVREIRSSGALECKKVTENFPDWSKPTFVLDRAEQLGSGIDANRWRGSGSFGATVCLGWQDDGLRLGVRVKDREHDQPFVGEAMWQGDSIQFGIDAMAGGSDTSSSSGYYATDYFLYGLSLPGGPERSAELFRWRAPKGKPIGSILNDGKEHRYRAKVEGGFVIYDAWVAWSELGSAPKMGDKFGFNLVVFDRCRKQDGVSDLIWLQLTPGIAGDEGQSPALWGKWVISE